MSSKTSAASVQVTNPDDVRNVVLIGNAGSGKTSLFEQLLKARLAGYRGEKEDAERAAQLYLASLVTGDVLVNLLDAPGHPDFVGELRAGHPRRGRRHLRHLRRRRHRRRRAALWEECSAAKLPRIIALTKLDAGHADFDTVVAEAQDVFGEGVLPTHVPTLSAPGVDRRQHRPAQPRGARLLRAARW